MAGMRQMVIPRKGQSSPAGQPAGQPPADESAGPDDGESGEGGDVETCPNCACQFIDGDEGDTPKVVKPGKPVEGGSDYKGGQNQGADLDTLDSAEPTPGKMGTAHDAASGSQALAALLGPLLAGGR